MSAIPAYPLQWPVGWKRTERRREAPYRTTMAAARDHLVHELQLLGARNVVISTNVPVRLDGLPMAGARPQNGDPGVAVYWTLVRGTTHAQRAIACDKWLKVEQNMRAIGLSIAAMRAIQRCGTSEILDRIFTGFAQLPAVAGADGKRPWREVFMVPDDVTLQDVERLYKLRSFEVHPDRGGSEADLRELNQAIADARAELRR